MSANDKLAATFHPNPAPAFGQLVIGVTGPLPINGPAHHITPEAHMILVRLGWAPPKEETQ